MLYIIAAVWLWSKAFAMIGASDDTKLKDVSTTVTIKEWDTLTDFFEQVSSGLTTSKLKLYHRKNPEALEVLQPGSYIFSGDYSFAELFEKIDGWPEVSYNSVTVLEWRWIYDVDALLSKELIAPWEYIDFATDPEIIATYTKRFDFLAQAKTDLGSQVSSLEWYLYPETYFLDPDKDIVDQLIFLQLQAFETNIWIPYQDKIKNLTKQLGGDGYDFRLSTYAAMRLASIIEKEERVDKNKNDIAGVFYNRLQEWMRLDADISLCYGMQQPYEKCTPAVIGANVTDANNIYNTRAVAWLPPTPISNIHVSSMKSLIQYNNHDYLFYLHDENGQIHLWETLEQHNINKSKYILR